MPIGYSLRQLEYFIATAEAGSVAAAAAGLNISQPSVSTALTKLEQYLGIQLFIRIHAQGVKLTPSGERLLAEARLVLQQAGDWEQQARMIGTEVSGSLRLGAFATLAPAYLPGILAGFSECYPKVEVNLVEGNQDQLIDGLRAGRQELALLYDVGLPDDIAATVLARLEPYVLLNRDHPLAGQARISLKDVSAEPFILLDMEPSRRYFLGILDSFGIRPDIAFSSPSLELVRGLVGRGLGFSLLVTRPGTDTTYDGHRLVTKPIAETVEPGIIVLAKLKKLRATKLLRVFTEFCQQHPPGV